MPIGKRSLRFNITIGIRVPVVLAEAVDRAALRRLMTPTEYVRGAIFDRLVEDGVLTLEKGAQDGES